MHENSAELLNALCYFTVVVAVMSNLELNMKDDAVLVSFTTQILLLLELSHPPGNNKMKSAISQQLFHHPYEEICWCNYAAFLHSCTTE